MKLLTAALLRALPAIGSTEKDPDPMVHCKFFVPWGSWTWYVSEFDPATGQCFGLVDGHEMELGYFSLTELQSLKGPGGLRIERDMHWTKRPMSEVQKAVSARRVHG